MISAKGSLTSGKLSPPEIGTGQPQSNRDVVYSYVYRIAVVYIYICPLTLHIGKTHISICIFIPFLFCLMRYLTSMSTKPTKYFLFISNFITGSLYPIIFFFENASNYSREGSWGWCHGIPHICVRFLLIVFLSPSLIE